MPITIDLALNVSAATKERLPSNASSDATSTLSYPTLSKSDTSTSKYYSNLSSTLKAAIVDVGDLLTTWRDAVGDEEREKEKVAASIAKARIASGDMSDEEETI